MFHSQRSKPKGTEDLEI